MMGMFHMLTMFMSILNKRFADTGLRDILIQRGVIAEGSADRALCGKMYNRGVRTYKLMYEAVTRKLFDQLRFNDREEEVRSAAAVDITDLNFDSLWTTDGKWKNWDKVNHYRNFG